MHMFWLVVFCPHPPCPPCHMDFSVTRQSQPTCTWQDLTMFFKYHACGENLILITVLVPCVTDPLFDNKDGKAERHGVNLP